MRAATIAAILTVLVVQVIAFADAGMDISLNEFGFYNGILSFACAAIGFLLCLFARTREIGKGILIGSGLLLVVGFATCTLSPHIR
jgi:hypothetical protein